MMKKRVFATCNIGDEALRRLQALEYDLEVYDHLEAPPQSLILERVSGGIDGLITTLRDEIGEPVFRAGASTLKVVAQDAVGFDNIDREAANRYGVPFTNTAEVLTHATAEFALFILGAAARKLYPSEEIVRGQQWKTWHPSRPILGDEVTGKTVAVVGLGRIGRAFVGKCLGLGVTVIGVEKDPDEVFWQGIQRLLALRHEIGLDRRLSGFRYAGLNEALAEADFVSLHVPLTAETRGLIGEAELRRMKSGAYLINTSRGAVVDEAALCRALQEDWIAGAALDVFEQEPLAADSPLRDPELADRLRLFHHFASGTRETRLSADPAIGMAGRCVQGLIDVLEGRYGGDPAQMPYVVNKEAFVGSGG